MLLTIDAGNTNTTFALWDGDVQKGAWRASTDARRTADEYAVWLSQLLRFNGLDLKDVSAAIVSTVVPACLFNLRRLCERYMDCRPMVVGDPEVHLGMEVRMPQPEEVGADRLINSVAARSAYPTPLVVIDFGTATNFDVVAADGAYIGGVLAPGVNLSLEALHQAAAKLPLVDIRKPKQVVGNTTISAMQSGIFWGYVGLIEGILHRVSAELGAPVTGIATGGLAPLFAEALPEVAHVDQDLTLRGLLEVYKFNILA